MKIWLHWPEKHHIIQHGTACAAAPMTHGTLSLIAFTSASFFFFFFCEKWIYICCFLTCRENSIMPPFIIAAFRSSGLFEVLSGIKLMEHLTFLLCRHTLLSLLHRPHTRCITWHAVWKTMCQVIRATCHFTAKANLSKWDLARCELRFVDEVNQTVQSTFIAFAWLEIWCTQMIQSKEY